MSIPQTPQSEEDPIAPIVEFLDAEVRPVAEQIDQDADALKQALDAMGERGFLGLRVPTEYGGLGFAEHDFRRFQEACARVSGCLAFLQTQHQSACAMLAKSENGSLKSKWLPKFANGSERCGIAFSQLRRKSAQPVLKATPQADGYALHGEAPWVTGLGFFGSCVTAATVEADDSTLFVLHPLEATQSLELSPPMRLASMEPAQTVSARFDGYYVPEEQVLFAKPGNWIENNDMINIALQSPFALGCAAAGIDIVRGNFERKSMPAIEAAYQTLEHELKECRAEAYRAMDERDDTERGLESRGRAIELALRCAATAVVTSSGAGNSLSHPAQRVYREALVFSVSAQTGAIMDATLAKLRRT